MSPRALMMQMRKESTSSNLSRSIIDAKQFFAMVTRTSKAPLVGQPRQAAREGGGEGQGNDAWDSVVDSLRARP